MIPTLIILALLVFAFVVAPIKIHKLAKERKAAGVPFWAFKFEPKATKRKLARDVKKEKVRSEYKDYTAIHDTFNTPYDN